MSRQSNTPVVDNEMQINQLLQSIDDLDVLPGQSKSAKLQDVSSEITRIEADLVGLRRLLRQHRNPNVVVDDRNTTIAKGINQRITQLHRLREYRAEIETLADDDIVSDKIGENDDSQSDISQES